MLLDYEEAAKRFSVGISTLHRMIREYEIEVLRVRTGASQRRLPRIDEAEIERVIEQMRTETDNGHRAGRGVQRKSVCPKSAKVIVMDYSNGKTRHAGMSRTQTPGAKELNDLLEQ